MLNDRLVQLSSHIGGLTEKLQMDAQHENPDRPQQEGDDTPELLEYLTQLKWLFETREQTHKELFDLLTERNEKYKAIVMLPYRQANNSDKVRGTEAFFLQDRVDRQKAYCAEALARHKDFFSTVEDHVSLGVQLQSSAFWDIAPSLMEILQTMPEEVPRLDRIAIPETEYLEKPVILPLPTAVPVYASRPRGEVDLSVHRVPNQPALPFTRSEEQSGSFAMQGDGVEVESFAESEEHDDSENSFVSVKGGGSIDGRIEAEGQYH